jgi:hypothetical protein
VAQRYYALAGTVVIEFLLLISSELNAFTGKKVRKVMIGSSPVSKSMPCIATARTMHNGGNWMRPASAMLASMLPVSWTEVLERT